MQRADGELAAGDYRGLSASRAVPLATWAGLAGVMALGLGLRLWRLGQNGYGTEYYSAGIRSMMDSPHNFLFNSFDPAGFVSLDKPPVALWIQVASVKAAGLQRAGRAPAPGARRPRRRRSRLLARGASLRRGRGPARRALPRRHPDQRGHRSLEQHGQLSRAGAAARGVGALRGHGARKRHAPRAGHGPDRRRLQREDAGRVRGPAHLRAPLLRGRSSPLASASRPSPRWRGGAGRRLALLGRVLRPDAGRATTVRRE